MSEYLRAIPTEIPAGTVVVHNSVRPTRRLGSRGFRAWLSESTDGLVACACGWASELGGHYRIGHASERTLTEKEGTKKAHFSVEGTLFCPKLPTHGQPRSTRNGD